MALKRDVGWFSAPSYNIIFTYRAYALGPAEDFGEAEAAGHTWHSPGVMNTGTLDESLLELTNKRTKQKDVIQIHLSNHQVERLSQIVQKHKAVFEFLVGVQELELTNYYIGAGCITQTVWNYLSGMPLEHGIKDVDFVYFDDDLSEEKED